MGDKLRRRMAFEGHRPLQRRGGGGQPGFVGLNGEVGRGKGLGRQDGQGAGHGQGRDDQGNPKARCSDIVAEFPPGD